MRACLACLLGLASALKIQKMVDEMVAAGLQPVPHTGEPQGGGALESRTRSISIGPSRPRSTRMCQPWSLYRDVAFPHTSHMHMYMSCRSAARTLGLAVYKEASNK